LSAGATQLIVERTGALLCERLALARTVRARLKGLLGRDGLEPGEGLWIEPCNSVHTFFMRFPIDVLFLDGGGAVVAMAPRLAPWRATRVHLRARAALELAAGAIEAHGVLPGDRLHTRQAPV
jgi:uncharacterized protein